jgi:hypothetical protein
VLTRLAAATAVAASLTLAACGGDDKKAAAAKRDEQSTPARALSETGKVREQLAAAVSSYKGGDEAAATSRAEDAYLDHFELVEGPLEDQDPELKETLEHAIREELVGAMKDSKPASEVEAMAQAIDRDLATAEAALR